MRKPAPRLIAAPLRTDVSLTAGTAGAVSDRYASGAPNVGCEGDALDALKAVAGGNFEVVATGTVTPG